MKGTAGAVFSLAAEHPPVRGCTISDCISGGANELTVFSLARHTDISAELYPCHKLLLCLEGGTEVRTDSGTLGQLPPGGCMLTPADIPVGTRAEEDTVYTEILIRRNDTMNEAINPGEVFRLAELVPVQAGRIVNMDVAHNDTMKLAVMAFDAGTGLSEHAAPGDALIFALDGEGIIIYEGKEYPIRAGENFRFAKGGMHAVRAEKPFKMALFLVLDSAG